MMLRDTCNLRFDAEFVGKGEHLSREIGSERFIAVIRLENAVGPVEEIRVRKTEFLPGLITQQSHALVNQQNVCPGNGLVIEIGSTVRRCKMFQSVAEA